MIKESEEDYENRDKEKEAEQDKVRAIITFLKELNQE